MKKFIKMSCVMLLLTLSVVFVACNGPMTLWQADFTKGNENVFGVYGTPVENKEKGYVTLNPVGGQNYSSSTYFGKNDTKNFPWENGGLTVSLTVDVKKENLTDGKYAVWSLSLNETDGKYITEEPVFFIGDNDGVYFLYKFTGVDTDYSALKKDNTAIQIADGKYTVNYIFTVDSNDELKLKVTLTNETNMELFKSENNQVTAIDHTGYTNGTTLKQSNIAGLRYLWLARTNTPVDVYGLKVSR